MNLLYDSFFKSVFENIEILNTKYNNYSKINNIIIFPNEKNLIYWFSYDLYKLININFELLLILNNDKIWLMFYNSYIKRNFIVVLLNV